MHSEGRHVVGYQDSCKTSSGRKHWRWVTSLLKVIFTNSTLAACQNPVFKVPGVGPEEHPSAGTFSTSGSCTLGLSAS